MRKTELAPGEYYHVYNKRILDAALFRDKRDFARFLFLALFFQSPSSVLNTSRHIDTFIKKGNFDVDQETIKKIAKERYVELMAFALMPTHFHLLVGEVGERGISRYLHRIQMGFAKYSHLKYGLSGHIFKGPFGATRIKTNNQLNYLSTYIHRNPRELPSWKNKEHLYPWSSYADFIENNRWGQLLKPQIILEQFNSAKEYRKFTETSVAKEKKATSKSLSFPYLRRVRDN